MIQNKRGFARKIERHMLESVMITGTQVNGSSDLRVLDHFLPHVRQFQLDAEALLFYGKLLEKNDKRTYIAAFASAFFKMLEDGPQLLEQLQLRPGLSLEDLERHKSEMRDIFCALQGGIKEGMIKSPMLNLPTALEGRLRELVQALEAKEATAAAA